MATAISSGIKDKSFRYPVTAIAYEIMAGRVAGAILLILMDGRSRAARSFFNRRAFRGDRTSVACVPRQDTIWDESRNRRISICAELRSGDIDRRNYISRRPDPAPRDARPLINVGTGILPINKTSPSSCEILYEIRTCNAVTFGNCSRV